MSGRNLTILLLFVSVLASAQEGQFSQFYASSIFLNPAFCGLKPSISLSSNYKRSQQGSDGSYHEMYQFSLTYPLQKITSLHTQTGGIGLTASNESVGFQGIYQTTKVLLTGAYVLAFDRLKTRKLSFGLQGGVVQNRLNNENLRFGSQYNPYIGFDSFLAGENVSFTPVYAPFFSAGALFSIADHYNPMLKNNSMEVGMAVDYLNQPRYGFLVDEDGENLRRPMLFKFTGTSRFRLSPRYFFHPSALVLLSQENYQINLGTYFSTYMDRKLTSLLQFGMWYRHRDSFIFLSGIQYRNIGMGVSFDLNNRLTNPNDAIFQNSFQPSYEISLAYSFDLTSGPIKSVSPLF